MVTGKRLILGFLLLALGAAAWAFRVPLRERYENFTAEKLPEAVVPETAVRPALPTIAGVEVEAETEKPLPVSFNLRVPFTTQAPHANWDLPYQEACEEASALIVHHYWEKTTFASKEQADREILDFIDFENQTLGFYKDTTAEEIAQVIREKWGHRAEVIPDPTVDMIKREVSNGSPVIVPAYGKALDNPNFRNGGPLYHMLVIKGYTPEKFITNDPGTRKGADFTYTYDNLMGAIHDWNGGDVPSGQKVMIVVRGK